jgi:hypothetical protein
MRRTLAFLLALGFGSAASSQGLAKGVNPADNLTRADAALSWVDVDQHAVTAVTLSYEHRLDPNWGLRAFLTPFAHFVGDIGTGDFGLGARYIDTVGAWQLGAALDLAGSTGTLSAIGEGRFRAVPSALVVRPWSAEDFTAFEVAWVEWISRGSDFVVMRAEQGHLFPGGWFVLGDAFYRGRRVDYGVSFEVGKQLDERWQVALRPGYSFRNSGDPSVQLRGAYFF